LSVPPSDAAARSGRAAAGRAAPRGAAACASGGRARGGGSVVSTLPSHFPLIDTISDKGFERVVYEATKNI
jgi:hypothetical protein